MRFFFRATRQWLGLRVAPAPVQISFSNKVEASAGMDALRAQLPAVETDLIVRWIREERERRLP